MIILIGVSGSGKSTQGRLLADKLGCPWLSIGQLLRDHMGEDQKQRMLKGEMVDDQVLFPLIEEQLKKYHAESQEFILDGWPRSMSQAHWLVELIKSGRAKATIIIHLVVTKGEAHDRLIKRHRPDDTEPAIANRFKDYDENIMPIINYLNSQGIDIREVNGEGSEEEITDRISQALKL